MHLEHINTARQGIVQERWEHISYERRKLQFLEREERQRRHEEREEREHQEHEEHEEREHEEHQQADRHERRVDRATIRVSVVDERLPERRVRLIADAVDRRHRRDDDLAGGERREQACRDLPIEPERAHDWLNGAPDDANEAASELRAGSGDLRVLDDVLGRQLATVIDAVLPEGETELAMPDGLAPGTYVLRVEVAPGAVQSVPFTIVR